MDVDVLFAGVAVSDLESASAWYGRLFGRPPDVVVNDDEVMWGLADGGWLYLVRDARRAGRALATICVANLDAALAELGGRGVATGPVEIIGTAGRRSIVVDDDGNRLSVIEVHEAGG